MTPAEMVQSRTKGFTALHKAFYEYFVSRLRTDSSEYSKYYLQLQAVFFDDIELQKAVLPVWGGFTSNLAEKQACARAALYDALVAHTFGSHLATQSQIVFDRMNELEAQAAQGLNALHQLINVEIAALKASNKPVITATEAEVVLSKESENAVPKKQQARAGKKERVQE